LRRYFDQIPGFPPRFGGVDRVFIAFCPGFDSLCGSHPQVSHPDQVVRRRHQVELPSDLPLPDVARLPHSARRLHPAEDFLDALAETETVLVAGVARSATIDRRRSPRRVLHHSGMKLGTTGGRGSCFLLILIS
jgi:hypothetical protein